MTTIHQHIIDWKKTNDNKFEFNFPAKNMKFVVYTTSEVATALSLDFYLNNELIITKRVRNKKQAERIIHSVLKLPEEQIPLFIAIIQWNQNLY